MDLKEKIKIIADARNLEQKQLANELGINHIVFNRNVSNGKMTTDMCYAFAERYPEIDLNYLIKSDEQLMMLSDVKEDYQNSSLDELSQAITILQNLKEKMSRR